jgi:DNA-binding HxlR family transcriptional regulator
VSRVTLKRVCQGASHTRMSNAKYNVYAEKCPTRQALDRIADKWTALIVGLLGQRTHRFGELRRGIEGISHKVLSQNLQSLERDGLVVRKPIPTVPPTVEYSLTPLGGTLVEPLAAIRAWAERHIDQVEASREAYVRGSSTERATEDAAPPSGIGGAKSRTALP